MLAGHRVVRVLDRQNHRHDHMVVRFAKDVLADRRDHAITVVGKRNRWGKVMDTKALKFDRDSWGRLVLTLDDGQVFSGVEPVRCFPLSDPEKSIALLDSEGREIVTLPALDSLNPSARDLIKSELASRDFVPVIRRVMHATNPNPPCRWSVETDRGETSFQLESEDDIRKLGPHRVMIADSNGIRYSIPDVRQLDAATRRIVERLV